MASNKSKTGYVIGGAAIAAAAGGIYLLTRPAPSSPPTSTIPTSVPLVGVLTANASTVVVGQSVIVAVNITNGTTGAPVSGVSVTITENTTTTEGVVVTNSNGVGSLSVSFEGTGTYSFVGTFF